MLLPALNGFLRFASGVTPADQFIANNLHGNIKLLTEAVDWLFTQSSILGWEMGCG